MVYSKKLMFNQKKITFFKSTSPFKNEARSETTARHRTSFVSTCLASGEAQLQARRQRLLERALDAGIASFLAGPAAFCDRIRAPPLH
jgi:hypothetical protein